MGTPEYLARHGTPERPQDLLRHECITFLSKTTGALYSWELERGRKTWRVPVRGGVVTSDGQLAVSMAKMGLGLAYAFEPTVRERLRDGRLRCLLGYFLYFPSRAQRSVPLRLFHRGGEGARDPQRVTAHSVWASWALDGRSWDIASAHMVPKWALREPIERP